MEQYLLLIVDYLIVDYCSDSDSSISSNSTNDSDDGITDASSDNDTNRSKLIIERR